MSDLINPADESPLAAAIDLRKRDTLRMVQRAVETKNIRLAFQPVVGRNRPDRAVFFESLIRLLDDQGRVIPARDFIDAIERHEIGRIIDCLALEFALVALRHNPELRLSVNMSARSIGYGDWLRTLERGIARDGTAAGRLILEITEASAIVMPEVVQAFMSDMHGRGLSFALDDFGAGYTAIRYLRDMYFDIVKIDGQFIRNIDTSADNQTLTKALVSISRHFEMLTVAESVETKEEAETLARIGVDCMQGYLYGAPKLRPGWFGERQGRRAG